MFDRGAVTKRRLRAMISCFVAFAGAAYADSRLVDGTLVYDPTRPAGWNPRVATLVDAERPNAVVESIIYSSKRKMARVNGTLLTEGQQINDIMVVSIEPRRVLLEWQGRRWYSSLASGAGQQMTIRRSQ